MDVDVAQLAAVAGPIAAVGALGLGGIAVAVAGVAGAVGMSIWVGRERVPRRALIARGLAPVGRAFAGVIGGASARYEPPTDDRGHAWGVRVSTGGLRVGSGPRVGGGVGTGDALFDRRFAVRGAVDERAWLTAPVRSVLLGIEGRSVRISDGWAWVESDRFDLADLDRALAIHRWLGDASPHAAERIRRVAADPVPEVRRHLLVTLAERDPAFAVELADRLRGDPDPQVQAQAAILTRDPLRLVASAVRREVSAELRRQVAETLVGCGSATQRRAAGEALVAHGRPSLVRCGVELLRSVGADGEPALLGLVATADGLLLERAVSAVAEVGTVAALPVLAKRARAFGPLQRSLARMLADAEGAILGRIGAMEALGAC